MCGLNFLSFGGEDVAQRRVQASLERRGKRAGQPTDNSQTAEAAGR